MTAGMPQRLDSNISTITTDNGLEQPQIGLEISEELESQRDETTNLLAAMTTTDDDSPPVNTLVVDFTPSEVIDGMPLPPPREPTQQRDTSVTTNTLASSQNGRESLRIEVARRRNTLTLPELEFLERLTVVGTEIEVELAMQTLADDDLFFDYATPRHLKYDFNPFAEDHVNTSRNQEPEDTTSFTTERVDDDDAVPAPVFSRRFQDVMLETRGSMGATLLTENDGTRDGEASTVGGTGSLRHGSGESLNSHGISIGASSAYAVAAGQTNRRPSDGPKPPVPAHVPVMIGSKKRMEVLERRRTSSGINLGKIWKAHETGLAVTAAGSKMSMMRRQSTGGSVTSGISAMSGSQGPAASHLDIFRQRGADEASKSKNPATKSIHLSPIIPPRPRRPNYGRSNSVTFGMMRRPTLLVGKIKTSRPKIPEPQKLSRRLSTGSRKSVTFHHIDEEFEFHDTLHEEDDESSEEKKVSSISPLPQRSKILRRANSDSVQYESPSQKLRKAELAQLAEEDELAEEKLKDQDKRESSTSTLTSSSLEKLEKQDSFPSLHHGHPIRQDSITSIPSIHHAHPIRQDSISSIPSLHHGHPIRQDSFQSIPSLHHGHPLMDSSVSSIPSLHPGQPIRSNSIHSIPSLHHGHPLQSPDDLSEVDVRRLEANAYSASDDIVSAWIQQKSGHIPDRSMSATSLGSLPHNVTFPLTETDTTVANTSVVDDLSVLSPTGQQEGTDKENALDSKAQKNSPSRPILMRLASRNMYEGEGIEVTELDDDPLDRQTPRNISIFSMDASILSVNSFDDMSIYSTSLRRTSDIFRTIRRSYSDESMASLYLGPSRNILMKIPDFGTDTVGTTYGEDFSEAGASWDLHSEYSGRFDAWNVLQDDYANGYGGGGTLGFAILGTSASDESAQPHVLSPPLMESLQAFLPHTKSGQNFFLKYSMVRDGASLPALLRRARGVQYSIIAVETIDGEVFGSFTAQPWRKNWNYFGTGESFLWRMRRSRLEKSHGILEQAQKESEIDVFPYTGENRFIQLCTHDRLAVGGGLPSSTGEKKSSEGINAKEEINDHEWGFGLAIQSDMLQGTSSPCLTFGSPSLSNAHSDGSLFEIINVELWTLTPCATVEEAEKLELGKLFLQRDMNAQPPHSY
ncbi:TLD domain containing protein [Nitzschia inconspicua]|uniref:Oxidation resistance protein 1 n=1 Tax=Nitzschia inconspicua TaxID=303405 RepID=A0A9K3KTV5_9STRA|nr:TLD domain containing protein [Nitzschia inconspicua]